MVHESGIIHMMKARHFFLVVGLTALVVLIYLARDEVGEALRLILTVNLLLLLLIIPMHVFSHLTRAWFFKSFFKNFGYEVSTKRLFSLSWAILFVNTALPSVGVSALSLTAFVLAKDGIPYGKTTLSQIVRYAITYISFLVLLAAGLGALYFANDNGIHQVAIQITIITGVSIIVASIAGAYILYHQSAFNWAVRKLRASVDWASRKFRRGKDLIGSERIEWLLYDFHDGFHQVVKHRVYLKQPFLWGLAGNVSEITMMYLVFLSLGHSINIGIIIIAYALANLTNIINIIPGNIGMYEVATVGVLSLTGVPLAVSVSGVILYRVTVKLFFQPVGFYFYTKYMKEA